jgi:1-acyl-sn-glycerol-3-phosphate acyltransferase
VVGASLARAREIRRTPDAKIRTRTETLDSCTGGRQVAPLETIDGFKLSDSAPFHGFDPAIFSRVARVAEVIAARAPGKVEGIDRIPAGRAILVANHAFGWDVAVPAAVVWRETGRTVWSLGEHAWWKVPFLRKLAAASGVVDGTPENVDTLLEGDQLVLVLPGGLREAMKPSALRYRLLWGRRYGFVRAALRNQAPIVPLACVGADEMFELAGNAFARGKRLLGRFAVPLPLPVWSHVVPWLRPLTYRFGEPIQPELLAGETEEHATRRIRREVEGQLSEMLDEILAERAGFPLTR